MKCLKEKCIHHDVCALYTFSGYASDKCGFYETRPHGEWIRSLLQTLVDNGCITAIQANRILKEGEKQ